MNDMQFMSKSKRDHWVTPDWVIEMLEEYISIDLDPCPGKHTQHGEVNFKLPYLNGLTDPWCVNDSTTAFVNPPFSEKEKWLSRAVFQYYYGNVDRVIFLTPDSTDVASWWHKYIARFFPVTWFATSRINFVVPHDHEDIFDYEKNPPGEQASGVSFNTALHFLGEFPDELFYRLNKKGDLVVRWDTL